MRAFLCGSGSTAAMATQSYCARVVEKLGATGRRRRLWGGGWFKGTFSPEKPTLFWENLV